MRTEEGLLLLNEFGRILWSNIAAAELLGFSREELCQLSLPLVGAQPAQSEPVATQRILLAPQAHRPSQKGSASQPKSSAGPVTAAFRAIFAGTMKEAEGNARIPDRNEKRIAVHWRLWALPNSSGKRRVLFSFSETAQASEEGPITSSYRDVFEHAIEGIYRSTFEGRLLEVNPALARMCGYATPAEMVENIRDLNWQFYLRSNRRSEFLSILQENGAVSDFESETYRADGSVFWAAEFARVVFDSEGTPVYFEGSIIDISERKRAESALRINEEKFRSLVETTRVIPFEFHLIAKLFGYVGPQAECVFGSSFGTGSSLKQWMALVHPDDLVEGTRFAQTVSPATLPDYQTEFRIRVGSAGPTWIRQIVHFDFDGEGMGPMVRGFFFEVTEAKLQEVEREESRIQLRSLAARLEQVREEERMSIAGEIHDEVGQALTLLKIDLSMMLARIRDPMTTDDRLILTGRIASMEEKIETAFQTVRRILLSLRPPLLEELGLKDAIEFHLEELARRAGFRYEMTDSVTVPLSIGTKTAIFRIVQELLTNVVKHAKASRVKVIISESGNFLLVSVIDNGCGLSEEDLKRPKSFGILQVKERAAALGGSIELQSVLGKGTTVTLRIPMSEGPMPVESVRAPGVELDAISKRLADSMNRTAESSRRSEKLE